MPDTGSNSWRKIICCPRRLYDPGSCLRLRRTRASNGSVTCRACQVAQAGVISPRLASTEISLAAGRPCGDRASPSSNRPGTSAWPARRTPRRDDDVLAGLPVHRRRHCVLRGHLHESSSRSTSSKLRPVVIG